MDLVSGNVSREMFTINLDNSTREFFSSRRFANIYVVGNTSSCCIQTVRQTVVGKLTVIDTVSPIVVVFFFFNTIPTSVRKFTKLFESYTAHTPFHVRTVVHSFILIIMQNTGLVVRYGYVAFSL